MFTLTYRRRALSILGGVILVLLSILGQQSSLAPAEAQGSTPGTPSAVRVLPPNQPELGLIYNGLEQAVAGDGPCKGLFRIPVIAPGGKKVRELCTHGPDPASPGVDIKQDTPPIAAAELVTTGLVQCVGDGVSGYRTEVIYARSSDVPDRYSQYLASIKQWAADADAIYRFSAANTRGIRRVRFVHDSSCNPIVQNAVLSPTGDDDFTKTVDELTALGYDRTDRKYMIFMDANVYCGIANLQRDDQPGSSNLSNFGPLYGRTDAGCWGGSIVAHEHMHTMGGVQLSAPNSSGGGHCTDEYDVMCYSDGPYYPTMNYVCTDPARESRFDCNFNDYYNTNPPAGSYLATHWNVANSRFLYGRAATHTISGYVRDFNLEPVPNAKVILVGTGLPPITTDSNGFYSFQTIPDGPYDVRAWQDLCLVETKFLTVDGNESLDFQLDKPKTDGVTYSCKGVPFSFISGDNLVMQNIDDSSVKVSLPFAFRYYGKNYSNVHIASNGFVNFLAPETTYFNTSIPDASVPNGAIYAFWDDLMVDGAGGVYTKLIGTAPTRQFVIEWRDFFLFGDSSKRISFEIVLYEDGRILTQYSGIDENGREQGDSATIGIENETGNVGMQLLNDEAALGNNVAVLYSPPVQNIIFANSFEDTDCFNTQWSACVDNGGDIQFDPPALVAGSGGNSMHGILDDNQALYVMSDHPNAEKLYRASFQFDPNSISMVSGDTHLLFGGYDVASALMLRLQFRFSSGNYQVQGTLLDDATTWRT